MLSLRSSMTNKNLQFDNITISGEAGVGKSTLINNLKLYLETLNWQFKSIGDFVREHLKDNVMPEGNKLSDEMNKEIEHDVYQLLKTEKHWVIQAWLSGFTARDLPNTLRILLVCKEPQLKIDRIANRDHLTIQQAKEFVKQREGNNVQLYKRLYGDYNFWDPQYYQLVIDTYSHSQDETVHKVLDALGYKPDTIKGI